MRGQSSESLEVLAQSEPQNPPSPWLAAFLEPVRGPGQACMAGHHQVGPEQAWGEGWHRALEALSRQAALLPHLPPEGRAPSEQTWRGTQANGRRLQPEARCKRAATRCPRLTVAPRKDGPLRPARPSVLLNHPACSGAVERADGRFSPNNVLT